MLHKCHVELWQIPVLSGLREGRRACTDQGEPGWGLRLTLICFCVSYLGKLLWCRRSKELSLGMGYILVKALCEFQVEVWNKGG